MTRASDTARLVSGGAVINEASNDVDFRVESNGNTHALFVDAGNDHVNINTDSDLDLRYKKLRNSVFALIFWNIIVIDIALIYKAFTM